MSYEIEVEELLLWFMLLDWWDLRKPAIFIH
jgi:hypothetical protein